MKMKQSTIHRYTGNEENKAQISREALEDRRLKDRILGTLLFICNYDKEEKFHVGPICLRFNITERTCSTRLSELVDLGYLRREHPGMGWEYWVTDSPGNFDKPHVLEGFKEKSERNADVHPPSTYMPPAKRHISKYLNVMENSQEDMELGQFYLDHGYALPQTTRQWTEARKPGIAVWIDVTEHVLEWIQVPLINEVLLEPINEIALTKAWKKWTGRGYKPSNADGILEWYSLLCKDKNAEPWNKGFRSKSHGRHKRSGRQPRQEHGVSKAEFRENDYSTIDN